MGLREAIPFLKGAVMRSLSGGAPSTYVFSNGVMYAQGPEMLAAYPMPHLIGDFALDADDLEAAIGRMPTEPIVESGDGTLIFKAGRLRSTIQLFPAEFPEEARSMYDASVEWQECPASLWSSIAIAVPFVAKEGSWQRAVCLLDGRIVATSNISGIEVQIEDLTVSDGQAALTDDIINYLVKLPTPERWREESGRALYFSWESGAWVRCRLLSVEYNHLTLDEVIAETPQDGMIEITKEWRDALADIHALAVDGKSATIDLGPDGMIGRGAHSEHVAEFNTGCTRNTRWALRALAPVFEAAQEWSPDVRGAASFRGKDIRGVVVGMSR